jgi:hypothetical protein
VVEPRGLFGQGRDRRAYVGPMEDDAVAGRRRPKDRLDMASRVQTDAGDPDRV